MIQICNHYNEENVHSAPNQQGYVHNMYITLVPKTSQSNNIECVTSGVVEMNDHRKGVHGNQNIKQVHCRMVMSIHKKD